VAVPLPLTRGNRFALGRAFAAVPRVDLSIDCVLEDQMGGALVDRLPDPKAYQILVPPFAYFAGDPASPGAQAMLAELGQDVLLMPSGPGWALERGLEPHWDAANPESCRLRREARLHAGRVLRRSLPAGVVRGSLALASERGEVTSYLGSRAVLYEGEDEARGCAVRGFIPNRKRIGRQRRTKIS